MPRENGDTRANPDRLLKAIEASGEDGSGSSTTARGHLKIFFGYAAGVGKTYAMLTAAHAAKRRGVDVVAGYIEPHKRSETAALTKGLEQVPLRRVEHGDIVLSEFDIDAAIARAPQLILVDELAHTNAPGSRHAKRYQDVEELLHAGIDVYTTVNVQHIESLNDMVASITGVIVRERIPDRIFDDADQVELVDIEPADLLERLRSGKVYQSQQAARATSHFFTVENLTALREIALRRCADRMGRLASAARVLNNRDYHTSEHILVCLSSSPTNPRIIRSAARMAHAYRGQFTALFVENPRSQNMSDADRKRLQENMDLAEQLGAKVETVYGDDVAFQIAEFARLSGVSEIVMGRQASIGNGARLLLGKKPLIDHLVTIAPNLDVHIIPDRALDSAIARSHARQQHRESLGMRPNISARHVLITCGLLGISTAIGMLFHSIGFDNSSIISLYILASLLTAVTTTGRVYTLLSAVLSVALYNFCFVAPVFTLETIDRSYLVTFLIMFVTAAVASELTSRIADNARQSAKSAYRTRVLLETNQLLQQADGDVATEKIGMSQLVKLLSRDVVFYPTQAEHLGDPLYLGVGGPHPHEEITSENERAVAVWVFTNNKRAGSGTTTLPDARCQYLAVRTGEEVFGVVGIVMDAGPLDAFEQSIMLSIIGECALALARNREASERQEAAVFAKNEQLRGNLLRSIGHDLRTPLTAISGSAGVLAKTGEGLTDAQRRELADTIWHDSLWLVDMVENVLSLTRLDDGSMELELETELLEDVIDEAIRHLTQLSPAHPIHVVPAAAPLLVRIDVRLITQVLVNLIGNAIKYTPDGTPITVTSYREGDQAVVKVSDTGPGIPDSAKPHVFSRVWMGENGTHPVDHHRSLGLGLALCHSIVTLHHGTISVSDNKPHGAVFRFTLPIEEVTIHE